MFDPLGLTTESAEKTKDLEEKEIKNGRLAMVAFAGFMAQHQVRRGGGACWGFGGVMGEGRGRGSSMAITAP